MFGALCLQACPQSWAVTMRHWGLKMEKKWSPLRAQGGTQVDLEAESRCGEVPGSSFPCVVGP